MLLRRLSPVKLARMSSKWIEVPSADAPAAEVARQALAARVAKVERTLPLAAYRYREDVEHVHQLRTSCRRAAARCRHAPTAFRPSKRQG